MKFILIDRKNWKRKEYFEHYLRQQTSFSMTSEVDITILSSKLKERGFKFYPAFIYMVTKVVNSNENGRNMAGGFSSKLGRLYCLLTF